MAVSAQFPAGLRVLVVDDDPTCLRIVEKMLRSCLYEVTKCCRAKTALNLLRDNKYGYDIVISEVSLPDMDGFKLLEQVGQEMDLPVILMSADDRTNVVMRGVTHGACDYLIKPVRIEALKNIWQHAARKRPHKRRERDFEQSGRTEDGERQQKTPEDVDYSSSANEGNWENPKKGKDEEDDQKDKDDTSTLKKLGVVWSIELDQQFVAAVRQLGIGRAVPREILELMNFPGLTSEEVARHLQKYCLYLKRLSGVSQHQNGLNNSFMGTPDATFGSMSSITGLDFQALAATSQIPTQSLASLQAAALGRPTSETPISMPVVDQRNLSSFESPKIRFGEGQQQLNGNNEQTNFQGIPTNLEPEPLVSWNQSAQSFGGMNMQLSSQDVANGSRNQGKVRTLDKEYGINREVLAQHSGKKLEDVAEILGISRSTLKRICRKHHIFRWPPCKAQRFRSSVNSQVSIQAPQRNQPFPDLSLEMYSASDPHTMPDATELQNNNSIMVKATYRDDIIKFPLSLSSRKLDLEEEVAKRINLSVGSFKIKYLDEDDDWVLMACDADLRTCMSTMRSLGKTTIKMLLDQ